MSTIIAGVGGATGVSGASALDAAGGIRTAALATGADAPARSHDIAKQFERIFLQQMVAGFRQTTGVSEDGGMFGNGPGAGTYGDMFDGFMSQHLSGHGGVGIADLIVRDLARYGQLPGNAAAPTKETIDVST
jgi:peptidoglycan hydrolase FlgJ